MNFSAFFIKRPVFTIVISLVLIILGVISYQQLPVRKLPNIEKAAVTIFTDYPGANPQLIEQQVTTPLENSLAGLSGIESIHSESSFGESRIHIRFNVSADVSEITNDIRDKLSFAKRKLPDDIDPPIMRKVSSSNNPAIILGFSASNKDSLAITDYLNRYVKPQIEELDGVGQVFYFGGRQYAIRVNLKPLQMAARHISVSDIEQALKTQTSETPSGKVKSLNRDYPIFTLKTFLEPQSIKSLILSSNNHTVTRLSDVANIKVAAEDNDSALRVNGKPAVGIGIIPQSMANPVMVANAVLKKLPKIQNQLPPGMHADVVYNSAKFIQQSIHDVYKTLVEAVIFVSLVILLFLGSWRASIIPIITVPICLLAVFWPMHLLGFSINTLTLLALVLAIGLVVDDAIVVLENIERHRHLGLSRMQAALTGSKEIVFAVIAMTLTLAAVYAPLAFSQGFTGKLFLQFGATLAASVIISGIVALTLSPMMCAHVLTKENQTNAFSEWVQNILNTLETAYAQLLAWVLNHSIKVIIVLFALIAVGYGVYQHLPQEMAPTEDQGAIIGIVSAPDNASFHYTNTYAKKVEAVYKNLPDTTHYLIGVGFPNANKAFSVVVLKPWGQRKLSQKDLSEKLTQKFQNITGVRAFPVNPSPLGRHHSNNHSFGVELLTSLPYSDLKNSVADIEKALKQYKGLHHVDNDLSMKDQQFHLTIDDAKAADLNVPTQAIADTIGTMIGGKTVTQFHYQGQSYPVILRLPKAQRDNISAINNLYVKNSNNDMIPLQSLVKSQQALGATSLPHFNRLRAAEISAELSPGYSIGQVVKDTRKILQARLPQDVKFVYAGSARDYLNAKGSNAFVFLLALVFIYLVLAAQFESFIDPFIILFSVPLAIVGALITLWLTGTSLNVYSNIGMVTLIGLIAKHGILITDFANQLREQGEDKITALIKAAGLRLRPILMTTAAMVLGALPLALATGAGAESRKAIGWVIVGGMLTGTFFSLFVVPVMYKLLSRNLHLTASDAITVNP